MLSMDTLDSLLFEKQNALERVQLWSPNCLAEVGRTVIVSNTMLMKSEKFNVAIKKMFNMIWCCM